MVTLRINMVAGSGTGRRRGAPAYKRLYRELREALERGDFREGRRMPTEADLCREYGVSRHTVRQAFQDLVSEGLVYLIPGRGTFATSLSEHGRYLRSIGTVEEIVLGRDGLLEGLSEGDAVIDTSSSRPSSTRNLSGRLAAKGIGMLDAPVSGGGLRAETGDLTVMVDGEAETMEENRAVLEAFGSQFLHAGTSGAGHMAKALNNLLAATTMASAAEAVLLGERAGLDPEALVAIINASSGRSASTEVKFPRYVLNGEFDDGFAISLMSKDLGIALDTALELGFPTVMGTAVGQVWRAAVAQSFGGEGHNAIYSLLEAFTGDRTDSE